jgi:photosystem II stability/assembly factor-like uncharacterized protein
MKSKKYLIIALALLLFTGNLSAQKWVASPGSANLLPNKYYIPSVKMVDKDTVWAVSSLAQYTIPANHLTKVLRTINGGQTWQVINVSAAIGRVGSDIDALDAQTAWITTTDRTNSGLFKTSDGGVTWVEKLRGNACIGYIRFLDINNGVCIGTKRHFAYTTNGGDNWTVDSTSMPFMGTETVGFYFTGTNALIRKGDTLWFGTSAGRIMRSTNKGRNWAAFSTGIPASWAISSVAFKDARNGMLAGIDTITLNYKGIAKTNDGGVTWQIVPQSVIASSFTYGSTLTAIPNKNEKTYMFGIENATSTVATTILTLDDGNTWQGIDNDIHSHGGSEFISPKIGWMGNGYVNNAVNSAAMFKWDDNGLFTPTAEQYDNTFFSVNPNPATDILTLQFNNASKLEAFDVQITDDAGRIVLQNTGTNKQLTISQLPNGIYFLTVKTKDKIGATKFVKN